MTRILSSFLIVIAASIVVTTIAHAMRPPSDPAAKCGPVRSEQLNAVPLRPAQEI